MIPLVSGAEPKLRDAVRPLRPQILATDDVGIALKQLQETGVDYLVVADAAGSPIGLITHADFDHLSWNPEDSPPAPCADLIETPIQSLHPEDSFDGAVSMLQASGVRPLLVRDEGEPIGVLEPTTVFQWCAQHRPKVLEELAERASRREIPGWKRGLPTEP